MIRLTTIFIFTLCFCLLNCTANKEQKQSNEYYNLLDFIKKQINILSRRELSIKKTIINGNKKQSKKIEIKNWEKELSFFLQADISKPSLEGEYEQKKEIQGQYEKLIYKAKKSKLKVKLLEVWFEKGKPKKMNAILKNDNFVYGSDLSISLECDTIHDSWQIIKYSIKASQKIVLGKLQNYEVIAQIVN